MKSPIHLLTLLQGRQAVVFHDRLHAFTFAGPICLSGNCGPVVFDLPWFEAPAYMRKAAAKLMVEEKVWTAPLAALLCTLPAQISTILGLPSLSDPACDTDNRNGCRNRWLCRKWGCFGGFLKKLSCHWLRRF